MKTAYIRLAAFALFALSFFLPAIRMDASGPAPHPASDAMIGWMCAWFASILVPIGLIKSLGQGIEGETIFLPMSGLINYLFLAVCILSFWPRLRRTRLILEALMLPCFIATWIFFSSSKTTPLIGHFLWLAACVLVAVPDAVRLSRNKELAAAGAVAVP